MIDLSINKVGLEHNIQKAKENNVIIPTIAQMQNPDLIPEKIKAKLSHTGLWDVDPVNLMPIDRKSGSAGMPRPISYAVFCLKKKKDKSKSTRYDSSFNIYYRFPGRNRRTV